jgi:hypothetical protein
MKRGKSLNLSPIQGDDLDKGKHVAERVADADSLPPYAVESMTPVYVSWRLLLGNLICEDAALKSRG